MRILLLIALIALPAAGQFRSVSLSFTGVGCASCTESMGERVRRLRGVEDAKVDAEKRLLVVRLAEQNRVRIEQIRDFVEQDGTKATRATVRVTGDLAEESGRWLLRPSGASWSYAIKGANLAAGRYAITGEIREMHAASGVIEISATNLEKAP